MGEGAQTGGGFPHIAEKNTIPVCRILGVGIAAISMDWLLRFTEDHIKELSGDYMCVSNVHTVIMAYEDRAYQAIQNGGIMAIPDGGPLSSMGRRRGYGQMQRIAGPSYMEEIFKRSGEKKYRHYFLGSTKETLEKLKKALERDYPGIRIAGMCSPPFTPITEKEDREIVDEINAAEADFIWVGLGAPKQERWMANHQGRVKGFMAGIGAGMDYFAGNIRRAPQWMQRNNMEWLYRLAQEPRRLFGRYWHTNWKFIWYVVLRGM